MESKAPPPPLPDTTSLPEYLAALVERDQGQKQQQALARTVAESLDAEQRQLSRWLASVRAGLATLSDPSFVLPQPADAPR